MRKFTVTLDIEAADVLGAQDVDRLIRRGLDAMPEVPYIDYTDLNVEFAEYVHEGDRCDECGYTPANIGCPDGAQICQRCFDAGLH